MSFFIVFLITVIDGVALSYLTKRRFGRTAAVVNLAIVFLLYFTGLFLRLDAGMYLFFALSAALVGVCVGFIIKRKDGKGILEVVKNPLFIVYLCLGLVAGIALFNKLSHDYDEMTHWALVVKNMYTYNNFGNVGDTTTMFNRYVPAVGVFMYAFQFLNKTFVNGNLYAAFDVLIISLILPLPERFGKEKPVAFWTSLIAPLVLVSVFKYNIYFNLRIDALIGIMGAYVYFAYFADRGSVNWWTLVEISLGVLVLTLSKSVGLALAAIAIVLVILDILLRGRDRIKPFFKNKLNFVWVLLPIIAIVFAKVSWNVYCEAIHARAGWDASELTASSLWQYISSPNEFQTAVNNIFWRKFFIGKINWYAGSMQQPFILVFLIYTGLFVVLLLKKQKALGIGMYVATILILFIYAVVNLIMYIFSFSYDESLRLASWPRYYNTALTMMALVWIAILSEALLENVEVSEKASRGILVGVGAAFAVFSVVIPAVFFGFFKKDTQKVTAKFAVWIATVETLKDTDRVYYAATEDVEDYFLSRYLATPVRSSGWQEGGSYAEGRSGWIYTGDPFSFDMTADDLKEALANYDYFFLDKLSDEFAAKYGALFDGEVKAQTLYAVDHSGGNITLVER